MGIEWGNLGGECIPWQFGSYQPCRSPKFRSVGACLYKADLLRRVLPAAQKGSIASRNCCTENHLSIHPSGTRKVHPCQNMTFQI